MKKTGDLYIFERGSGLCLLFFRSGYFLCIFWRPTRSRCKLSHKNSSLGSKMQKTVENGHFGPFLPIFEGFWDFSRKRL